MKPKHDKPPAPARKATVKDVAEAAGASISSVSRVLNDYPGVHPSLSERVLRAVEAVGYVPPSARRRQHPARPSAIYFILANRNLHIPFHSKVLQALENRCAERRDLLLYRSLRYAPETPAEELGLGELLRPAPSAARAPLACDGVILTGTTYPNFLEALRATGVPFVLLGNNYSGEPLEEDAVYFDGAQGAYEATRHLVELGHRDILFIGDTRLSWYANLHAGYLRAVEERGLEPLGQLNSLSDSYYSNGYLSVELALEQARPATAILAGYDEIALGAWKALNDRGLGVPRDMSLVGFDDEDYAAFTVPPLTTVRIDVDAIGGELVRLLYRKMAAPGEANPSVTLPTVLVKRSTCRPV
jgi:DNA-binding LacI/PurR family transcriptional regulator